MDICDCRLLDFDSPDAVRSFISKFLQSTGLKECGELTVTPEQKGWFNFVQLLEKVEKAYQERVFAHSRNKKFVLAELGNDAGIMGAAALILEDTNKA
jgi:predicted protein tyrosine phosphatase